ncbi:M48 family metalloprotease [Catenuloplanes indicus]|uniref:Zn-dependent protease with chaperone function n=1 Tax=Catenuloplanes indicus TaxID=137267 RepID=A0AAE3VUE3_9ACTN|nr:M48 family metalloprotease [Catenuloplanes indicus]MDQ0363524.1 Zn-dependent protease with chaperone function [Catenuloplanes indicus]
MLDHFILSVVVCPAVLAIAVRSVADRLRPEVAVPFLAWSIAGAAAASTANLAVFTLKALAEQPLAGRTLGWSDAVVRHDTARVPWITGLSAVLLAAAVTALARAVRRYRQDLAAARPYLRLDADANGVVLIHAAEADAFAVPIGTGRIVITTAMRDALDARQYAALLAHERAHLTHRHHHLAGAVRFAVALHPVFRLSARRMEYLVERAADEIAAGALRDRRTVATAIGAAALVAAGRGEAGLRMAPAARDLRRAGAVPRRVACLLGPRRRGSWLLVAVLAAIAVFSVIWTGECVWDLAELLSAAR